MVEVRRKKLMPMLLLGSVGLSLAACGGSGGGGDGPVLAPPPPPATDPGTAGGGDTDGGDVSGGGSPPPPPPVPAPSGGPFGAANPFALPDAANVTEVRVDTLHVFGDSNSVASRDGIAGWPGYLKREGTAGNVVNNAVSGAFGGNDPSDANNSFARQLDREGGGATIDDRDLVAVAFGANDVEGVPADRLDASIATFAANLDALRGRGAANDGRRLFVTTLPDLDRTPGFGGRGLADDVRRWNDAVRGYANANANANTVAVDLYTVFERVFADPGRFGFTDVTDPAPSRADKLDAASGYLWADEQHLTQHGQDIIGQVFQHYLTRGWDWANALDAGAAAQARLEEDLDAGGVVAASLADDSGLGLVAVPLGDPAPAEGADPSRAGFAAVQAPEEGGAAFELRREGQTLGFAFGRYGGATASDKRLARQTTELDAEAFALYARQEVAGFDVTTRVTTTAQAFERRDLDEVVGGYGRTGYGGRASALGTRLTLPFWAGGVALRPWAELGWRRQAVEGYTLDDAYLGPVRYDAASVSEVLGGLGLGVALRPIDLGRGRTLTFGGDLGFERTFGRDDLKVRVSDAGGAGDAVVPRDEATRAVLNLNGALHLSETFDLTTGLGLVGTDAAGTEAGVSLGGRLRF